jgi:hypothetical protein
MCAEASSLTPEAVRNAARDEAVDGAVPREVEVDRLLHQLGHRPPFEPLEEVQGLIWSRRRRGSRPVVPAWGEAARHSLQSVTPTPGGRS